MGSEQNMEYQNTLKDNNTVYEDNIDMYGSVDNQKHNTQLAVSGAMPEKAQPSNVGLDEYEKAYSPQAVGGDKNGVVQNPSSSVTSNFNNELIRAP